MRRRSLAFALVMIGAGCGSDTSQTDEAGLVAAPPRPSATTGGRVVATVDGTPITIDDVETVARATGLAPIDALRRLEEEAVLGRLAEDTDAEGEREADSAARRAAVQALLAARVEREITPAMVPDAEVAERRTRDVARFTRPERRRSVHALARVTAPPGDDAWAAAERWARRAHAAVAASDDPEAALRALAAQDAEGRSYRISVEDLPPASREDHFVREYLDPLFAAPGTGLLSTPIQTQFGWHVVLVQDIAPRWTAPVEEVDETVRDELCQERRAARLAEWTQALWRDGAVQLDDARARALLSTLEDERP